MSSKINLETQNRLCKHHVYLFSHLPVSFVQEKHLCHPNSENKIYTYVSKNNNKTVEPKQGQ